MNKDVFVGVVSVNETVSVTNIEPLHLTGYTSCQHFTLSLIFLNKLYNFWFCRKENMYGAIKLRIAVWL